MFLFNRTSNINKNLSNYIKQSSIVLMSKYKRTYPFKYKKSNINNANNNDRNEYCGNDDYGNDDWGNGNNEKIIYFYISFVSLVTILIVYQLYKKIKQ